MKPARRLGGALFDRWHGTKAMRLDGETGLNLLRKFSNAMIAANSTISSSEKLF